MAMKSSGWSAQKASATSITSRTASRDGSSCTIDEVSTLECGRLELESYILDESKSGHCVIHG